MIYFDSSVLLELYLNQPRHADAQAWLGLKTPKLSSWLLAIEVPVVLRRVLGGDRRNRKLLNAALDRFDADLLGFSLYDELSSIASRVRQDERMAQCRSLDAVHIGAVLQLQAIVQRPLTLATFDDRVASLGKAMGIELQR